MGWQKEEAGNDKYKALPTQQPGICSAVSKGCEQNVAWIHGLTLLVFRTVEQWNRRVTPLFYP